MKRYSRLAACTIVFALGCGTGADDASPKSATVLGQEAEAPVSFLTGPLSGKYAGTAFTGTLYVNTFVDEAGSVFAIGNVSDVTGLSAAATKALTGATLKLPLAVAPDGGFPADAGTEPLICDMLQLWIPATELTVAGKPVSIAKLDLDITSTPGSGAVLGQILCGVPDLLESGGALSKIEGDLSTLIGILNGLTGLPWDPEASPGAIDGGPTIVSP